MLNEEALFNFVSQSNSHLRAACHHMSHVLLSQLPRPPQDGQHPRSGARDLLAQLHSAQAAGQFAPLVEKSPLTGCERNLIMAPDNDPANPISRRLSFWSTTTSAEHVTAVTLSSQRWEREEKPCFLRQAKRVVFQNVLQPHFVLIFNVQSVPMRKHEYETVPQSKCLSLVCVNGLNCGESLIWLAMGLLVLFFFFAVAQELPSHIRTQRSITGLVRLRKPRHEHPIFQHFKRYQRQNRFELVASRDGTCFC